MQARQSTAIKEKGHRSHESGEIRSLQVTHLEGQEDGMGLGSQAYGSRSLFYGFEGIFDLVQPALGREHGVIRIVRVPELRKPGEYT